MAEPALLSPPGEESRQRTATSPAYRLAEGTELIGQYQNSGYEQPKFLVRRVDGQVMQLPHLLYRLAGSLDGRSAEHIAAELGAEFAQDISPEDVTFLVEERLRPVGLVSSRQAETTAGSAGGIESPAPLVRADPLLALRYRVGIIPAGLVMAVAGVFAPLFRRPVWLLAILAFVGLDAAILLQGDVSGQVATGTLAVVNDPALILAIFGLGTLSAAFHECGHVAACRYGGARPGEIGIGLYLIWPAFYSTVTDSYRLNRAGRLRTDLGGVYFNAVFMTGLSALYVSTGRSWLIIALIALHVETAWQFLPSIRLDGYYILADLIGVPDLFAYVGPVLARLVPGRPTHPRVRELRASARRLIVAWVALVVPALTAGLVLLLLTVPAALPRVGTAVLAYLDGLDAAARNGDLVTAALGVLQLLLMLLPWVGLVLILISLLRLAARHAVPAAVRQRIPAAAGAAARRSLALVLLAGVCAALVLRVLRVAATRAPSPTETQLVEGAFAAVRGAAGGPGVDRWDLLLHYQLVVYARLTGSFDRHGAVLTGGRELAVAAAAVLLGSLVTLVVLRRLAPLAVALPLLAVLAMGPAVSALATLGPSVVGAAWLSVGVVLLALGHGRLFRGGAVVAVVVGVATQPLLALPIGVGAAVMLARGELRAGRSGWWSPSTPPTGARLADRRRRAPARHRAVRVCVLDRWWTGARRWSAVALLLALATLGAALSDGHGLPLLVQERKVLLLVVVPLVATALADGRLRSAGVAVGVLLLLAALPWAGSGGALPLAVLGGVGLAALLIEAVVRCAPPERPHPLLRAVVALPVLVVVAVGGLILPGKAPAVEHRSLASWINAPTTPEGSLAVPAGLWGDLIRDGVSPARLQRQGAGSPVTADWVVVVGPGTERTRILRSTGTGATALTVLSRSETQAPQYAQRAARPRAQLQAE